MADQCSPSILTMSEGRVNARLVYVVGASGSGKDSLMQYARIQLAGDPRVVFAHRYITRAADAGGENHVALSPQEFEARRLAQLFALHWQSHGLCYGIGIEINQWLAKGITVVINGSRQYLPEAAKRYPELVPIEVAVGAAVLRQRLMARGRETVAQVEERLLRHAQLSRSCPGCLVVNNDESLPIGGDALVSLIASMEGRELVA